VYAVRCNQSPLSQMMTRYGSILMIFSFSFFF